MKKYVIVLQDNILHFESDDFEKVLAKCETMTKVVPLFWRGERKSDLRVNLDHQYNKGGSSALDCDVVELKMPSGKGIRELNKLTDEAIVNLRICINDSYSTLYELERGLTKEKALELIRHKRTYKSNLVYKFKAVSVEDKGE